MLLLEIPTHGEVCPREGYVAVNAWINPRVEAAKKETKGVRMCRWAMNKRKWWEDNTIFRNKKGWVLIGPTRFTVAVFCGWLLRSFIAPAIFSLINPFPRSSQHVPLRISQCSIQLPDVLPHPSHQSKSLSSFLLLIILPFNGDYYIITVKRHHACFVFPGSFIPHFLVWQWPNPCDLYTKEKGWN